MANATHLDDQDDVLDLDDTNTATDTGSDEDRGDDFAPDDSTQAATEPAAPTQEDEDRKNGSRMVPIARFNEVNERMKEMQAQLAALATRQAQPAQQQPEPQVQEEPAPDLGDLRKRHHNALVEGRDDEAIELQGQIDEEILNRATQNAMNRMAAQQAQREQQAAMQTFQQTVQQIEADYPQLNANSEQADEDAILFVVAKRDALIKLGTNPGEALRQASDAAARTFGFGTQPAHTGKATGENRKQEALLRNAKAAQAQPPQLAGLGNRATAPQRVDVSDMPEDEFEALPESEKSRLRGD